MVFTLVYNYMYSIMIGESSGLADTCMCRTFDQLNAAGLCSMFCRGEGCMIEPHNYVSCCNYMKAMVLTSYWSPVT